jgi:hypothetical protein
MNSTKAEDEMKGRGEREEQRESRSSRVLQQTTMGKQGRRPTKSRRSTKVCCNQIHSKSVITKSKLVELNCRDKMRMMMMIPF